MVLYHEVAGFTKPKIFLHAHLLPFLLGIVCFCAWGLSRSFLFTAMLALALAAVLSSMLSSVRSSVESGLTSTFEIAPD